MMVDIGCSQDFGQNSDEELGGWHFLEHQNIPLQGKK